MTSLKPAGLSLHLQVNHLIPLAEAAAMTASFRRENPDTIRGFMFDRLAIDAILDQPGCAGIRIYRALKDDGSDTVVVVGTDEAGNDLVPATVDGSAVVAELSWPCPPVCAEESVLRG
jgi:hypothetical protein